MRHVTSIDLEYTKRSWGCALKIAIARARARTLILFRLYFSQEIFTRRRDAIRIAKEEREKRGGGERVYDSFREYYFITYIHLRAFQAQKEKKVRRGKHITYLLHSQS